MEISQACSATSEEEPAVTVDAVHPRFLNTSLPEETRSDQFNGVAYCVPCNSRIENIIPALRSHFENAPHVYLPCIYCKGPVYKYIFQTERLFHECNSNDIHKQYRDSSESSSLSEDESNDFEGKSIVSHNSTNTEADIILSSEESSVILEHRISSANIK